MRKLCAEGLAVEVTLQSNLFKLSKITDHNRFNKRLVDIQSLPESDQVIARFSDGTSATGSR